MRSAEGRVDGGQEDGAARPAVNRVDVAAIRAQTESKRKGGKDSPQTPQSFGS